MSGPKDTWDNWPAVVPKSRPKCMLLQAHSVPVAPLSPAPTINFSSAWASLLTASHSDTALPFRPCAFLAPSLLVSFAHTLFSSSLTPPTPPENPVQSAGCLWFTPFSLCSRLSQTPLAGLSFISTIETFPSTLPWNTCVLTLNSPLYRQDITHVHEKPFLSSPEVFHS